MWLNKYLKNPCVWYILTWILYLLQGTLYESGSRISQFLLLVILLVSVRHTYRVFNMHQTSIFFKGLNALILMYTFYGLLLFITDGVTTRGLVMKIDSFNYLKEYYMALLPIYSCYYYARKGYLTRDVLVFFAIVFVVVSILVYYRIQHELLEKILLKGGTRTETTNNAGYIILSVIPALLILHKKPVIQYIAIGVCVVFVFLAMKRGAILCLSLFLMMFIWRKMNRLKGSKRFLTLVIVMIGMYLLTIFVEQRMETSDYFNDRIEQTMEGDSSERDLLYKGFLQHYFEKAGLFHQIFGYGAYGTIKVSVNFAHNDWLEILTNQGLLGIIIFITFTVYFYRASRYRKYHTESQFALLVIFVLFLPQTFFSAGITNTTIFTSCMTGFALADGFRNN